MSDGPTKYDLVGYLAGIESIMQAIDKTGTRSRPTGALTRDYDRAYAQLHDIIHAEEDEAKRKEDNAQKS